MEATAISETTKKTVKFINDHNNVQKMERMWNRCLTNVYLERIFLEIWQIFMVSISLGGCLSLATASTTCVQSCLLYTSDAADE